MPLQSGNECGEWKTFWNMQWNQVTWLDSSHLVPCEASRCLCALFYVALYAYLKKKNCGINCFLKNLNWILKKRHHVCVSNWLMRHFGVGRKRMQKCTSASKDQTPKKCILLFLPDSSTRFTDGQSITNLCDKVSIPLPSPSLHWHLRNVAEVMQTHTPAGTNT